MLFLLTFISLEFILFLAFGLPIMCFHVIGGLPLIPLIYSERIPILIITIINIIAAWSLSRSYYLDFGEES